MAPIMASNAGDQPPTASRHKLAPSDMRAKRAGAPLVACLVIALQQSVAQSLVPEQAVALPSVQGRMDHMDIDLEGHRLFVAALGAGTVEVIDLRTGHRVARLDRLREPQGVAYLAAAHRLFVASGGSGDVRSFAQGQPAAEAMAEGLDDADNLRIDRVTGQLYVGAARALVALDPGTLRTIRRVELAGHPEGFQLEGEGLRAYVNVPSAGHVAVVDRSTGKVVATWGLGGASRNFPMALDEANHRLFVGTRQPAQMLVYDTATGKQVARLALCGDVDDLFYDGQRRQLYAICGEGVVDVLRQRDPDRYELARRVPTAGGARTGLFIPQLSTLFVAVPAHAGAPAEIRRYKIE